MPSKLPPRKDKNRVPRAKRAIAPAHKDAERVAKVIARAGLGSRREIEDWIEQGRVAVNGTVLQTPAVTVTAQDLIEVDGAPLPEKERTRLFLYHKPRGVVTTNRDPEGRTTLFEILPPGLPRLVSVGRLDLNSEGLLLLTNDGGLARALELPETGWLRRYRVRAKGEIDQAKLDALIKGITVEGITYGPIEATLDRVQGANAWITVALREGKNREVRNVLAALGMIVNRLIRVSYGPFQLGEIPEGEIEEVRTRILRDQIGAELIAASGADFDGPLVETPIGPAPARPAEGAPARARGPRRAEREPEFRGRSRHPDGEEADVVAYRVRSRTSRQERDEREVESRGSVSDRKGREIKVERVVSTREEPRPARTRPDAREDARPRSGGPGRARPAPAGTRPRGPRADEGAEGRPYRSKGPGFSKGPGRPERSESRREGFRREDDRREDFRRGDERPPRRAPAGGGKRPYSEDRPRPSRRPDEERGWRDDRRAEGGGREERPARRSEGPGAGRSYDARSGERPAPKRSGAGGQRPQRTQEREDVGFLGGRGDRPPPRDRTFAPRGKPRPEHDGGGRGGFGGGREGGSERPAGARPFAKRPGDKRPGDKRPGGKPGGFSGGKGGAAGGPARPGGPKRSGPPKGGKPGGAGGGPRGRR